MDIMEMFFIIRFDAKTYGLGNIRPWEDRKYG